MLLSHIILNHKDILRCGAVKMHFFSQYLCPIHVDSQNQFCDRTVLVFFNNLYLYNVLSTNTVDYFVYYNMFNAYTISTYVFLYNIMLL